MKRDDSELRKKVYREQIRNPTQGDFVELIKEDFKAINEQQNDDMIQNTNTVLYKKHIKAKMRISALKYLTGIQAKHSNRALFFLLLPEGERCFRLISC